MKKSDQRRRDEMSGFCKAIASKAAAFQVLDTMLDALIFKQRFAVVGEGMYKWTTLVSDQTIAFCVFPMIQQPINHRIPAIRGMQKIITFTNYSSWLHGEH